METQFRMRELRDGLEIRSWSPRRYPHFFFIFAGVILVFGVAFGVVTKKYPAIPLFFVFGFFILLIALLGEQSGQVRITKFDVVGTSSRRRAKNRGDFRLATAEVRWLEYRDGEVMGITGFGSAGIYAVQPSGATCILPFVDFQQAAKIISTIENRFPGLSEMWRRNQRTNILG